MSKLGISGVAYTPGALSVDNIAQGIRFERDADFITQKIGFTTLARLAPDQRETDLVLHAFDTLKQDTGVHASAIDCLVVVTQNPSTGGLPHMAAVLCDTLGLRKETAAFDIALGCSGYVYGLHAIVSFMESADLKNGLLVTVDPYSRILAPDDVTTALLFSDVATATLISAESPYRLGKPLFATDGSRANALEKRDGALFMDGRSIFNFSLGVVPVQIEACLEKNALSRDDVDRFFCHQASRFILENLARKLCIPSEKMPFLLGGIGNCVSSTLPVLLAKEWACRHKTLVLSGFGVGLSWGTTVLSRME